ncbi:MAG: D-TA family PLP-dependent enzyme, partial [Planctomycetales bacterium]|nr:D-TA family PLP-dependent enzyme [Planctomycetales bacterium]
MSPSDATPPWYIVRNVAELPSPALLVYPERVGENLDRAIRLAGGPERLRLHVKTHKMARVAEMMLERGIRKFKCATIAEAEMLAQCDAPDVLLAYTLVGPNVARFVELVGMYPQTHWSVLVDDPSAADMLDQALAAATHSAPLDVYLDVDNGLGRSGIAPGDDALALYGHLAKSAHLRPVGLHAYDGQIKDKDFAERVAHTERDFAAVAALRDRIVAAGLGPVSVVAGGTPTFPAHALHADRELSPGTLVFWDFGYQTKFPDLDFLYAAAVLTRVISRPSSGRLCLDLGYKAIAADQPQPRAWFPQIPDAEPLVHNEEHLA